MQNVQGAQVLHRCSQGNKADLPRCGLTAGLKIRGKLLGRVPQGLVLEATLIAGIAHAHTIKQCMHLYACPVVLLIQMTARLALLSFTNGTR